ncbi:MAG: CHAT domain-containing protein [Microcoleus sp.]
MGKLVILKLGGGNFEQGFPVTLQIGEEGSRPDAELTGQLPPAPKLPEIYTQWRSTYRNLTLSPRLEKPKKQTTQVSVTQPCTDAAKILKDSLNEWLNSEDFRPVKEGLLKKLQPSEVIRLIIQTNDFQHQQFPWHLWEILLEDYTKAEVALSAPQYERVRFGETPRKTVKVLAILGNSEGIDVQADRAMLEQLPGAEITFIVEPKRQELTDALWEKGWDILCFSGHSSTEGQTGRIYINKTDSLTVGELKNALRKAIERGLCLALFNSCDGLGLARDLADLHIPQVIVMREPVPDLVAQEFLKYFLKAFARGESFYLSVREARERLQAIEDKFPCATWLPVICQNPAEMPPTWQGLGGICADISQDAILTCPYRGLFAFREEDAPFFFGREAFTNQLAAAINRKQLVAVIGASGSGKSSAVFAGLIPELRSQENWLIISHRPGDRPFFSVATALIPQMEPHLSETDQLVESNKLAAALDSQDLRLSDVIDRILQKHSNQTQLLLAIDQFEELYTLCHNHRESQRWLDSLLAAIKAIPQLTIVLTLRADFLGQALSYRPFADALQDADVKLGPMNREELQRAIAQPAQKVGMLIEEGLTERILDAVEGEPGNLPLLEFALTLLWEKPRNGRLNHAAYKEIGGVESALALHAQQVYDKLNSTEKRVAKRIFLELTQLGAGTEDTRRQVLKKDLLGGSETGFYDENTSLKTTDLRGLETGFFDENTSLKSTDLMKNPVSCVESVIQQLAAAKLIVTSELVQGLTPTATVDVVHEALIRHWPLLRGWVEENREKLLRQRAIEAAAKEWQGQGEPEELAYLLQGPKLAEAESFLDSATEGVSLSSLARDYIIVSQAARDRIFKQEEERRQRELQQERRARIAAQRMTGAAISSLLVIVVSGGFAWWQRQQSLRIIQDVSAGIDVGTPQLLSILPDFLSIADGHRNGGDVDRALSYYRKILTEADKLLKPSPNQQVKLQPQEQKKLQDISLKAEKSLVETIQKYRLPQLEEQLKKGEIGKLLENTSLLNYEKQYTEGALRTTYAILLRELGAKADLNDDGELKTHEEANYLPCETLKAIDALWRKYTQNYCGWYDQKSAYNAPQCKKLDGLTLTSKILIIPPYDAAINRLNSCKVVNSPANPNS